LAKITQNELKPKPTDNCNNHSYVCVCTVQF